jgi:hypothetical protein
MVMVGIGSYLYLGAKQSKVAAPAQKPTAASPRPDAFVLPGTLYLAQSGAIYSLSAGRFHQLTPENGWTQPALFPNGGNLLVVQRSAIFSNVYVMNRFGTIQSQLTSNIGSPGDMGNNHWSFYPRLSPDGSTLFMSYDEPKYGYDVVMSVWGVPMGGSIRQGRLWTISNDYTGGDVEPIPLRTGGILYVKYSYGPDLKLIGQLWLTTRPGSDGTALTSPAEDCMEPAVSPDGKEVAMICTYEKQVAYLTIATFDGSSLGTLRTLLSNQLIAQPTWAPDGSGIAYLAPALPDGPFQLWFLPRNAYNPPPPTPVPSPTPTPGTHLQRTPRPILYPSPVPVHPIQITGNLALDATSPMAWSG